MKRFALLAVASVVGLSGAFAQDKGKSDTHELTVTVTDIPGKEDIVIALFTDKKGFPEDTSKAVTTATVKANKATHTFDKLPAGKYVVVVFQDKDGDGKITKGGFGPKEPIGLSNHPKIAPPLNMPDFDKGKVEVKKATRVEVNLITLGK
jgi:uncharacterized protein (DUF2141 family)